MRLLRVTGLKTLTEASDTLPSTTGDAFVFLSSDESLKRGLMTWRNCTYTRDRQVGTGTLMSCKKYP